LALSTLAGILVLFLDDKPENPAAQDRDRAATVEVRA